jgi:hypothetical protein
MDQRRVSTSVQTSRLVGKCSLEKIENGAPGGVALELRGQLRNRNFGRRVRELDY